MTCRYGWLLEDQIVWAELQGVISSTEFWQLSNHIQTLFEASSKAHVHQIIQVDKITRAPSLGDMLSVNRHPAQGWIIIVGVNNAIVKYMASIVLRFFKADMKFVNTMEEALAALHEADPTLPPMLLDDVLWLGTVDVA